MRYPSMNYFTFPMKSLECPSSAKKPCTYKESINEIITEEYPSLVVPTRVYFIRGLQIPTVLINLSNDWTKWTREEFDVLFYIIFFRYKVESYLIDETFKL